MDGTLAMTQRERDRLRMVEAIESKRLTQSEVSVQLGISVRQVKRLVRRVREQGAKGLVSGRRGKPSNRRTDLVERQRIIDVVATQYVDFGPTLASEYLQAHHGFAQSTETLRKWMIQAGLWKARRARNKRVYQLRERRARVGELIQIDGSPHKWFEDRGPYCTLIIFVDDASSRILYARFEQAESTQAYLRGLRHYVSTLGRPVAFYSDRHSIFTKHDPEDPAPTQFERAVRALDVEPILALSPQAKGRVERSFQTLQDRLVKGLRMARACTIEQGNQVLDDFIVRYNQRFGCIPALSADAHRPGPSDAEQLQWITSIQHTRTLSKSLSCQYRGRLLIINTHGNPAYHLRGAQVTICDDNQTDQPTMLYHNKPLPYRMFSRDTDLLPRIVDDKTLNASVDRANEIQQKRASKPWTPPPNHPWRQTGKKPTLSIQP